MSIFRFYLSTFPPLQTEDLQLGSGQKYRRLPKAFRGKSRLLMDDCSSLKAERLFEERKQSNHIQICIKEGPSEAFMALN